MTRIILIAVAIIVAVGALAGAVYASVAHQRSVQQATGATQSSSAVHTWLQTVSDDGSGVQFFIPAYDVHGNPNGSAATCSDPVWGTLTCVLAAVDSSTREGSAGWSIHLRSNAPYAFDEWSQDALGNAYWDEWLWNSSKHEVEQWRYSYRDASDKAQGVTASAARVVPDVAWMAAEILLASQTPYASPFLKSTLTSHGRTLCANDGKVHLYTARLQPAAPSCYPFDAIEQMVGAPREIVGGNYFLVVRVQGLPAHFPEANNGIPAFGVTSTQYPDLWDQAVVATAQVPFGRNTQLNYTPPPPGNAASGFVVSPRYMEWNPTKGAWTDSSGNALASGSTVTIAQTWYHVPWNVSQTSCTDTSTGGSVAPSTVFGLSGYAGAPWSVSPAQTFTVPSTPWTTGPFVGQDVGYSQATPSVAEQSGFASPDKVSCTMNVAATNGANANVNVVIDPSITPFDSWPESIEMSAGGTKLAMSQPSSSAFDVAVARAITSMTGGGVANAGVTLTPGCYAAALNAGGTAADALPAALASFAHSHGIYVDSTGCFTNSSGTPVSGTAAQLVWEPSGINGSFSVISTSCNGQVASTGFWMTTPNGQVDGMPTSAGSSPGACTISTSDGYTTTPSMDHGVTNVAVSNYCNATGAPGDPLLIGVGTSCTTGGNTIPDDSPWCDRVGRTASEGYNGKTQLHYQFTTGSGAAALNGDGSLTITVSSPGSWIVDIQDQYVTYNLTTCAPSLRYQNIATYYVN